jgi:hypothetical protein
MPQCYHDVDDVLDLSYVPDTAEDIDANDLLDLSYVPSTAEDIVLFEEKQKDIYSSVQASCREKSSLITGIDGTQGSLNVILIEWLIFMASITMRSPLPFLLSLLELL